MLFTAASRNDVDRPYTHAQMTSELHCRTFEIFFSSLGRHEALQMQGEFSIYINLSFSIFVRAHLEAILRELWETMSLLITFCFYHDIQILHYVIQILSIIKRRKEENGVVKQRY